MVLEIEQIGETSDGGGKILANSLPSPPSTLRLTEAQLIAFLQSLSEQAGGISEMARRLNIPYHNLYRTIKGKRAPDAELLEAVGAKVEQVYTLTMEMNQ